MIPKPLLYFGLITVVFVTIACDYEKPSQAIYGYESDIDACLDGRDNDLDGFVDCDDPDCVWITGWCSETVPNQVEDPVPEEGELCQVRLNLLKFR